MNIHSKHDFAKTFVSRNRVVLGYGGSPPNFFFNEIAGFETSVRPYLVNYGAPLATPTSSFDTPLQKTENM